MCAFPGACRYSGTATRGRNSGLFWALLQCSLIIGSVVVYLVVPGGKDISVTTASRLYGVLLVLVVSGAFTLLFLGKPPPPYVSPQLPATAAVAVPSDSAALAVVPSVPSPPHLSGQHPCAAVAVVAEAAVPGSLGCGRACCVSCRGRLPRGVGRARHASYQWAFVALVVPRAPCNCCGCGLVWSVLVSTC
jgi:hypothetical protein